MSQSVLLTGTTGTDLKAEAWRLAWQLVGENKKSKGHPDILVFDPAAVKKGGVNVGVKELRPLLGAAARTPLLGTRVVILLEADRLSMPAMNTLLKPLEEAPEHTNYILTSRWPRRLLATILSRCRVIRVESSDKREIGGENIDGLIGELGAALRNRGPSADLKRAVTRLRDFYQIKSLKGNIGLARQVALAAAAEIDHNLAEKYDTE